MLKLKKYISIFLLLLFAWVITPTQILHNVFANHTDTDCDFDHNKGGLHVESKHTHCDIFKTNTTLYNTPKITNSVKLILVLIDELKIKQQAFYFYTNKVNLPARAPPIS